MYGFKACSSLRKPQTTCCKKPSKRSEKRAKTPGKPVSPLVGNFRMTNSESYVVTFTLIYYAVDSQGKRRNNTLRSRLQRGKTVAKIARKNTRKKMRAVLNEVDAEELGEQWRSRERPRDSQHHQRHPQSDPASRDDENEISI